VISRRIGLALTVLVFAVAAAGDRLAPNSATEQLGAAHARASRRR
jgi:hypothetical protein